MYNSKFDSLINNADLCGWLKKTLEWNENTVWEWMEEGVNIYIMNATDNNSFGRFFCNVLKSDKSRKVSNVFDEFVVLIGRWAFL